MGIADDISPRRQKQSAPSGLDSLDASGNVPVRENQIEPKEKEVEAIFKPKLATSDSFFPPSKKINQKKPDIVIEAEPAEQKKSFFGRLPLRKFVLVALLITMIVLAYLNFDRIKRLFSGGSATSTSDTSDAVTIVPQDYTSGASTPTTTTDTSPSSTTASTPATTGTTAPAATTPVVTDKSTLTIDLLNGNGIRYSASNIKQTLIKAGYTVTAIGNAKSFAYSSTFIYYKTGFETAATELKSVLSTRSITLKNDDVICKTYDIVIVIGKK